MECYNLKVELQLIPLDEGGDTLTLPATTALNGRVKLTCITDDGTNSTWKAEALSTPIATIA